jgi:uncharacterized membrane protein
MKSEYGEELELMKSKDEKNLRLKSIALLVLMGVAVLSVLGAILEIFSPIIARLVAVLILFLMIILALALISVTIVLSVNRFIKWVVSLRMRLMNILTNKSKISSPFTSKFLKITVFLSTHLKHRKKFLSRSWWIGRKNILKH